MAVFNLCQNITAAQTVSAVGTSTNPTVTPTVSGWALGASLGQLFQVIVKGTGTGNYTATVQLVGSNDNTTWLPYGNTISVSGTSPASTSFQGTTPFAFFGAYVTAISGTGASVSVSMNA